MNTNHKIVFFGTSRFAVIVFDQLIRSGFIPALLVTTTDRPQGRKLHVAPPPAKIWALEHNIPTLQPEKLDLVFARKIHSDGYELAIVASYGTIIPRRILSLFPRGVLNVHPSLLPKYRGASPLQSAILADDKDTGVTIILLDEEMDHGPILAAEHITAENWPPNALLLEETLALAGGNLLAQTIEPWLRGDIAPSTQDNSKATFTKKFSKSDGELNLADDAYRNFLKIQAFTPSPGTFFFTKRNGKKIRAKITKASYADGTLHIERVIPESKHEVSYDDFLRGE